MPTIRELATLTSKGQITLPKSIRKALDVDAGSRLIFELRDNEVVVTRAEAEHQDPAIGAFLDVLTADIEAGLHVKTLPDDLAKTMARHLRRSINLDEAIDGDVAI